MRWGNVEKTLILADDGRTIPADPSNRDFAAIDIGSVDDFSPPQPDVSDFSSAIEDHIDDVASSRGYSSAVSLASYTQSTHPGWSAEAIAFVAWRDAVWEYAYGELAKVQGAQRSAPTVSELLAELPVIAWPS